jgi:hypothetical protein
VRYDRRMALPGVALSGIEPPAVLPGARLWLRGVGVPSAEAPAAIVTIGGVPARLLFAAPDRAAVEVPESAGPGRAPVRAAWSPGATLFVDVGAPLAIGLHLVDSPVVDAAGRVYAAFSGPRGQELPVSVYRIGDDGGREPWVEGIVNATSLAISPAGALHVSSRFEGTIYRIDDAGRAEPFATELGVACGLAFAPDGSLFVGDRSGTLHHVSPDGTRVTTFALLPPSVAAYHLTFGPDGHLYVTGPTMATRDALYRFDASGRSEVLDHDFGRPQGLAFDIHGVLHVVDALAGGSAIYRMSPSGPRQAVVAGPGLIGVAFAGDGALVAATSDAVFRFAAIP